jgi:uncharacterized membrane protein YcaP (DUF421 family)
MSQFLGVDWGKVFLPDTPVLEIIVRGTVTYLALYIMLRLILKREAGTVGVTDLLVLVLLADAAQDAMAGGYNSLADGLLLVGTIVFWAYALNWLGYHSRFFRRFVVPPPLALVRDGKPLPRNLRRELITHEELMSQLRLQGIEDLSEVEMAQMEPDGRISVVKKKKDAEEAPPDNERRGI